MDKIPVSFEYHGHHYDGFFTAAHGSGGQTWFLTIDGYHRGQLLLTKNFGWQFYNTYESFKELADYFGDVVTAWYQ